MPLTVPCMTFLPRAGGRRAATRATLAACAALALAVPAVAHALTTTPSSTAQPSAASASTRAAGASPYASRTAANPLAGRAWGHGDLDPTLDAFNATGSAADQALLAKMALQPKAAWLGSWWSTDRLGKVVSRYIATAQNGDPEALVQLATFRMEPWEQESCNRVATTQEQQEYKAWFNALAAAIGSAHVAIVQQPDGPFVLCAPRRSKVHAKLIRYGTRVLSALPHTSVYVEVGAADWPMDDPKKAAKIAKLGGVKYARGIALNGTHYDTTERQVIFGAQVAQRLAKQGMPGKTVVVNTTQNGRGFRAGDYHKKYDRHDSCVLAQATGTCYDHAPVCTSPTQRVCVTLGIPPTTDVANPAWGLTARANSLARRYVDGYIWFGRPWLFMQNQPFLLDRALDLARSTSY